MDFCLDYDFEFERVIQKIKEINAKTIVIQLPDGFQRCADYVIQKLKEYSGRELEIILSLNPSYGPCLIDEYSAFEVNADMIVHFGHIEYPLYRPRITTLFIPVEYKAFDVNKIRSLIRSVCRKGKKICITSTSQHIGLSKSLEDTDECSYKYTGVAFGCIPVNPDECDIVVVIAGGRFGCVSQYLILTSKDIRTTVYCLDPYSYKLWNPENEYSKFMKIRMWKVYEAATRRKWLIVTGYYGQARHELVNTLIDKLRSRGVEIEVAKVLKLSRDVIENLGKGFEVIVIASCPYLAFELYDMDKPVLTIGEALMIANDDMERYVYPW